MKSPKGWKRPFEEPIPPPAGRELVTLQDAARYIQRLPKAQQAAPEWQTATEALIMAAERKGPIMHARIGMLRAINAGTEPPRSPRRKRAKAYRVVS